MFSFGVSCIKAASSQRFIRTERCWVTVASLMSLAGLSSDPAASQPGAEPFPVILWGSGMSHQGLETPTVGSSRSGGALAQRASPLCTPARAPAFTRGSLMSTGISEQPAPGGSEPGKETKKKPAVVGKGQARLPAQALFLSRAARKQNCEVPKIRAAKPQLGKPGKIPRPWSLGRAA